MFIVPFGLLPVNDRRPAAGSGPGSATLDGAEALGAFRLSGSGMWETPMSIFPRMTASRLRNLHLFLTFFWLAALVPAYFFLRENIFWIIFISHYANSATHWGAWQSARAEVAVGVSTETTGAAKTTVEVAPVDK